MAACLEHSLQEHLGIWRAKSRVAAAIKSVKRMNLTTGCKHSTNLTHPAEVNLCQGNERLACSKEHDKA
jgi:hypothetical protein